MEEVHPDEMSLDNQSKWVSQRATAEEDAGTFAVAAPLGASPKEYSAHLVQGWIAQISKALDDYEGHAVSNLVHVFFL